MRASLSIGGVGVDLFVAAGPVERLVAARYAGFLGAPGGSACALELECGDLVAGYRHRGPARIERTAATRFVAFHPDFRGFFDLRGRGRIRTAASVSAVDEALRTLFAVLAPVHDALLLRASGVIAGGQAHVVTTPGAEVLYDPALPTLASPGGYVMVQRCPQGWSASSTPFQPLGPNRLPREGDLARLHVGGGRLEDSVVSPSDDGLVAAAVDDLVAALGGFASRLARPPAPAGVVWQ
jgi:hypothetical protein